MTRRLEYVLQRSDGTPITVGLDIGISLPVGVDPAPVVPQLDAWLNDCRLRLREQLMAGNRMIVSHVRGPFEVPE